MNALLTTETPEITTIEKALQVAQNYLSNFALSADFNTKTQLAFGNHKIWEKADLLDFPTIEIRPAAEINHGMGAFAAATNTIYLSQEFVNENSGNVGAIASVLLEEYGHYLDDQNNAIDSPGDEGELFADLVQGKALSQGELAGLKGEDDSAIVVLDGERVKIEQAETTTKKDTLNFSAGDISNWSNSPIDNNKKFEKTLFKTDLNLPGGQFNFGGGAATGNWQLTSGLEASIFATAGSFGNAQFSYPIDLFVSIPESVESEENFTIKTGVAQKTGNAGFDAATKAAELPNAGFNFTLDPLTATINNVNIKTPFKDFNDVVNVDISAPNIQKTIDILGLLNGEIGDPLEVAKLKFAPPEIKSFEPKEPTIISDTSLPDIVASGTSDSIIEGEADLDKILALSFPPFTTPLLALGGEKEFSLDEDRIGGKLSYNLLDIKERLGVALQQKFTFDPNKINVTMAVEGQPTQTGTVGDETEYKFTVPSEGCGVLKIKAQYELTGDLRNVIGVLPKGSIDITALEGEASLKSPYINGSIKLNPLFSKQFPEGGNLTDIAFPLIGSPARGDIDEQPLFPILNTINTSDIGGVEQDDSNPNGTKNLIVEVEYEIPYNLPVSISDASVTEGDSGTKDLVFPVTLRDVPKEALTLSYSSPKGNGSVTIAAGQTSGEIKIPVTGDTQKEDNETFTLTVKDQNGKLFADCEGTDSSEATGTIIDDDNKPDKPKGPRSNSHGEPHLINFDGLGFDFQAVGEFTLVKSASGDLNIQVRQQPVRPEVSVNKAVATVIDGKRIVLYSTEQGQPLKIDGIPTEIPDGNSIAVGGGRIYLEGNEYTIVYPSGDQLIAEVYDNHVNFDVYLSENRTDSVTGLLGNNNKNPNDDIALRDGTVLNQPVPFRQLYREFGESWRITQAESLFDYKPGEDTNTLIDRNFPTSIVTIDDLNPADRKRAEEIVDASGITDPILRANAILDIGLTGDATFLQGALRAKTPESSLVIRVDPEAKADFTSTFANTPVKINPLSNDIVTTGIPLSLTGYDQTTAKGGTIQLDNNGTPDDKTDDQLTYTPPTNFVGIDTINYSIADDQKTATGTITVAVPAINLNALNGNNGFTVTGAAGNFAGISVSNIGDFNGDSIDDFIMGGFAADPNNINATGESYVIFGTNQGFPANFDLSTLNGTNGFIVEGFEAESFSGGAVSSAGDLNGDGFKDLIIGAFASNSNSLNDSGLTYVVFGSNQPFSTRFNLANLNGNNGFVINSNKPLDYSGLAVSSAGDFNNDGLDDLAVAAPGGLDTFLGKVYLVYGRRTKFPPAFNPTDLEDDKGTIINHNNGLAGTTVSNAGDVNGDQIDDLIIGAEQGSLEGNPKAGETYVLFGKDGGYPNGFSLSNLDGTNGFTIKGDGYSVSSVSGAGDINADGLEDMIIGVSQSPGNNQINAGKAYVVFGTQAGFPEKLDLFTLDGNNGFVINGVEPDELLGGSVKAAGDINGDKIDDIIIGGSGATANGIKSAGKTYVVFGSNKGFTASLNSSELNGENGFFVNGTAENELSGVAVSSAGDINQDSVNDILIGAPGSLFDNTAGKGYVVFGSSTFGNQAMI